MKIAEYTGVDAIELLADIMEPVSEILQDTEIFKVVQSGANNLKIVQVILKRHKEKVLEIMAIVDQEDPETYKPNIFVLPMRLIELFSQPEMRALFIGQGQKKDGERSGSATENTEVPEE